MSKHNPSSPLPIILRGHVSEVTTVQFKKHNTRVSSPSLLLFSGDLKGHLNIFSLETRRVKHSFQNHHQHSILGFYQPKDENLLFSQGREGCIKSLDFNHVSTTNSNKDSQNFGQSWNFNSIFSFCKFTPFLYHDHAMSFFVPSEKDNVLLLDCRMSADECSKFSIAPPTQVYDKPFGMLTSMMSIENSSYLLCAYEAGIIVEFDVRKLRSNFSNLSSTAETMNSSNEYITVRSIYDVNNPHEPTICMNYQSQLDEILIGTSGNSMHVLARKPQSDTVQVHPLDDSSCNIKHSFEMTSAGINDICCMNEESSNQLFESKKNENDSKNKHHSSLMSRLAFAGCWDGNIRVFDLRKNKKLAVYKYHQEGIRSLDYVEYSNDSSLLGFTHANEKQPSDKNILLAAGSKDSKISIWNVDFAVKK
ncbi:hypothetical protein C9374_005941 [Naegleria lovaniensis]|uniref:Guanine nucleotide-binding protein subunit beta-like protein n=1 Tax=Naegleria lovaniensis TaxID=51637 RepID=A0AA88KHW1_NAELO|nr:uncharacterized protein C9374_005941 [Naegleria lovaniensis]KAG2381557.1 hypothetical protein C9374_005941 [Naegleria lovaniensis]